MQDQGLDWFQGADSYGESYSPSVAIASAQARPGWRPPASAGLSTYGVPNLRQAPAGLQALAVPGGGEPTTVAAGLPGFGMYGPAFDGYGVGASGVPTGATEGPTPTSASPAPPGQTGAQAPTAGVDAAFRWVLAWVVFGVLVLVIIRTQVGYRLVYYALALILLFLVLTNYQWFASALAPINQAAAQPGGLLA